MELKLRLITELSQKVKVTKDEGNNLFVEGIFSSAEIMNANGRRYKKVLLEREVNKVLARVQNKSLWSELGHPITPEVNPEKIAALIENLDWKDNDLHGRAKILDTPCGRIARTLISEGQLGISSRGLGTVSEDDNYVNDDFNLITWDLVTDPSNHPSWVKGIYEATFDFTEPEVKKKEEPKLVISLEDARKEYKKHVWQVLQELEKKL
jgi:hypothetical protein